MQHRMDRPTAPDAIVAFGPFRLDPARRMLWRGDRAVALRPKTQQVLLLLLHFAGKVVSKEEIFASVWEGKAVSDYVLTTCISELRSAMGDDPRQPRYLETLHRTGYQLLVEAAAEDVADASTTAESPSASAAIGRTRERQRLRQLLEEARKGRRRIVFVSGEMGVGKTTLVGSFLREIDAASRAPAPIFKNPGTADLVARGHCIEPFGAGEPYMPVFEAIGRLGSERDAAFVVETLRRSAPAWLVQIPGLVAPEERVRLRGDAPAQSQVSMLRQIADGIEALAAQRTLVLLLEDLHHSDPATVDLVALLAKRRGFARLLLVATLRTGELHSGSERLQGLRSDLVLHDQAEEIVVVPLSREAVETFVAERFAGLRLPRGLATTIHTRTEGNPLFASQLIEQLVADGLLVVNEEATELCGDPQAIARQVPRDVRAMIEYRVDARPPDERELLEVASVAGPTFRAGDVAAALGVDVEVVERQCSRIARSIGYLGKADPDAERYAFRHALYQQVLYERVEATRRVRCHRAIGTSLAAAVGREGAHAAELAVHFDRGADPERAIEFYDKAALSAAAQSGNREAVGYLDRALVLLEGCPDDDTHRQRRLDLLLTRGPLLLAIHGYAAEGVVDNYRRALALAQQLGSAIPELASRLALVICRLAGAELKTAEHEAEELVRVAETAGLPPPFIAQLRNPLSQVRLYQGRVAEALTLADAAVAAIDVLALPQPPPESRPALWAEPRVLLHCQRAAASFAMGLLAQAGDAVERALAIARDLRHPFNLTYALAYAAMYADTIGRWEAAIDVANQAISVGDACDIQVWAAVARIHGGHARARNGDSEAGMAMLRDGVERQRAIGGRLMASLHQNLLADAALHGGDVDVADAALALASEHSERTGESVFLAETLRLQAECLRLRAAAPADQEALLHRAIEIARTQGTRLWELRARRALLRVRPSAASAEALMTLAATFADGPLVRDILDVHSALAEHPKAAHLKET